MRRQPSPLACWSRHMASWLPLSLRRIHGQTAEPRNARPWGNPNGFTASTPLSMRKLVCCLCALLFAFPLTAVAADTDPPDTPQQKWFRDAKFGMFIHWGVYSVLGDGEWVMNNRHMSVRDYETIAPEFNPTEFNAAEWV